VQCEGEAGINRRHAPAQWLTVMSSVSRDTVARCALTARVIWEFFRPLNISGA